MTTYHWVITIQGETRNGIQTTIYTEGLFTPAPGQTRQQAFRQIRDKALTENSPHGDGRSVVTFFSLEPDELQSKEGRDRGPDYPHSRTRSGDRQSEWEEQPVKIRQKTSTDIAYEAGYSDGANSAIADVQIQFIDPLDGMDGLLEFFRGLIGDPDLAWPERAAKEET